MSYTEKLLTLPLRIEVSGENNKFCPETEVLALLETEGQ